MKNTYGHWGTPNLYVNCPHCDAFQDLWEQNASDGEVSFLPCQRYDKEACAGLEFRCEDCREVFELEGVEY